MNIAKGRGFASAALYFARIFCTKNALGNQRLSGRAFLLTLVKKGMPFWLSPLRCLKSLLRLIDGLSYGLRRPIPFSGKEQRVSNNAFLRLTLKTRRQRMAKLLVAGGLHEKGEQGDERARFATALGEVIIRRGHTLLGGCRTSLDATVAIAAAKAASIRGVDPDTVIRSWITGQTKPMHTIGRQTHSLVGDWSQIPRGYAFPEPIREADAVIIVGGWDGTQYAASWARLANKPLLPVATFGGAANDIFRDEIAIKMHSGNISEDEFQTLNRILPDLEAKTLKSYAEKIVLLAEKSIVSSDVFVIISFDETPNLIDAYNTFVRVCSKGKFSAFRVDQHIDAKQNIVPAIFSNIKSSAFIIAELSSAKPNVYYELGYARALGKSVIQTAFKGTVLPFDVFDVPTLFWDSQDSLEKQLDNAIQRLLITKG